VKQETPARGLASAPAAATPPPAASVPPFKVLLSSTRRGARLARLLVVQQLDDWGIPPSAPAAHAVATITAELAANAVTHGRLPGRDFELRLLLLPDAVRVEVSDARPERLPPATAPVPAPAPDVSSGRGLLLVEAFAGRWGCLRRDALVKTVWAEVAVGLPRRTHPAAGTGPQSAQASA
jgi:anti-sigma regulatory factor (Ser/Thr protein kinase)